MEYFFYFSCLLRAKISQINNTKTVYNYQLIFFPKENQMSNKKRCFLFVNTHIQKQKRMLSLISLLFLLDLTPSFL